MPIKELKRSYIADFGVTARQFNFLAKEQSLEEIAKERSAKLEAGIRSITKAITKAEKAISQCQKDRKAIQSYRQKVKAWRESSSQEKKRPKKPKMPSAIRKKFSDHLTREIDKKSFYIHQKKRRLGILTHKLSELSTKKSPSLCFGTKKSFLQQYQRRKPG